MIPGKLIPAGLVLVAGAWLILRSLRLLAHVAPPRRAALVGLRAAFVALLTLAILAPVWLRASHRQTRAPVLVALDDSASMNLPDMARGATRRAAVTSSLLARGALLDRLAAVGPVEAYRFADLLLPLAGRKLPAGGDITDLEAALQQLHAEAARAGAGSIVLVTDGVDTEGLTAAEAGRLARGLPPVVAVPVGGLEPLADRALLGLSLPRRVTAGKQISALATVRSPTEAGATVALDWSTSDGQRGRATASLGRDGVGVARWSLAAARPGALRVEARLAPLAGDALPEDDTQAAVVDVVPGERRVLYLDGGPRPELASLRRLVAGLEGVKTTLAVRKGPGGWWEALPHMRRISGPGAAEGFGGAVLYILGDLGAGDMPAADWATIARRVSAGDAALLVLGGPSAPQTPASVADLLPAALGTYQARAVTAAAPAAGSPLASPGARLTGLPALAGLNPLGPARPGATVPLRAVDGAPLVALRDDGALRSAEVATDSLYRWELSPLADGASAAAYRGLWLRLLSWLLQPRPPRPITLFASRLTVLSGERMRVEGDVNGAVDGVTLRIQPSPEAGQQRGGRRASEAPGQTPGQPSLAAEKPASIAMTRSAPDLMTATLPPLAQGRYTLEATATHAGKEVGRDTLAIDVLRGSREDRWPGPSMPMLEAIAKATGGRVVAWRDLASLPSLLPRPAREEQTLRRLKLGRGWLAALVLGLLLLADWALRKRWGLV